MIRQAKPNYFALYKSAVIQLKMDATAYNELLQEWYRLKRLHFDDDGHLILWEGQVEKIQELQDELDRYAEIIQKDIGEVAMLRALKEREHADDPD